jgi:hypothetical protein
LNNHNERITYSVKGIYGKENIIVCMLFLDDGEVPASVASVLFIKEASVHK